MPGRLSRSQAHKAKKPTHLCHFNASGLLVGTTAIREATPAASYVDWPWPVSKSSTAITYVPFDSDEAPIVAEVGFPGTAPGRVECCKIFSIVPWPE